MSERDVTEGIALAEARFHDVVHEPGPTRVPGAVLLPAVRPAALPHVDLAHVDTDNQQTISFTLTYGLALV